MKHKIKLSKPIFETLVKQSTAMDGWMEMIQNTQLVEVELDEPLAEIKEDLLNVDSALFQYTMANGGKLPHTKDAVVNQLENTTVYPYTTILLPEEELSPISSTGTLGVASEELPMNPYKIRKYFKKFIKNEEVIVKSSKGWEALLRNRISTINSALMIDPYLFHLDKQVESTTDQTLDALVENNLKELFDQLLPRTCAVPFHLLIATKRGVLDAEYHLYYSANYYETIFERLVDVISSLRDYPIEVELMVPNNLNHSRKLITNYYTITCDKGFKLFDGHRAIASNDFRMEPHFLTTDEEYGDIQFMEVIKIMEEFSGYYKHMKQNLDAFGWKNNERYLYFSTQSSPYIPFNRLVVR